MAMSAFNANAMGTDGAMGIAAFRAETWALSSPPAGASPWDPSHAIRALGAAMCALTTQMAGLGADPYTVALVAFRMGTETTRQAGPTRAISMLGSFLTSVTAYSSFYATDPRLNPTAPAPTPTTAPSVAGGENVVSDPLYGWRLTWSDDFSGSASTAPDATKWTREVGGSGWGNEELQYHTNSAANSALDGAGHLAITARSDGATGLTCWYGACRYTSARLTTANTFAQAYGRISARIKLPRGQGIWPSLSALGANVSTVGWPGAGELNVMNSHGDEPATVESGLAGPGYSKWVTTTLSSGTFADGYHTFTADWYPDHISFFVDGQLYHSQYRAPAGAGWVFDHPFFLELDIAVGGNQPGNPDGSTALPQQMLVDWVRVYQAGPPTNPATGRIVGLAGKCVAAAGTTNGSAVHLNDCAGTPAQTWTIGTDGTVRAAGGCLSVTGTANGSRTQLLDCGGAQTQVWQAQTNGQLVNPASGRCLDVTDKQSVNGTPLQIWDCWGASNQVWGLP